MTRWPLEFAEPWALLLLPLAVLLWVFQRHSPAPLAGRRRIVSLALRVAIFACLCLALSDPKWLGSTRKTHFLWTIDVSRSVGDKAMTAADAFIKAAGDLPPGSSQSRLYFAGQARPFPDKPDPKKFRPDELDDEQTDLAAAAQFATASFPMDKARTLVMFTDGVETEGDFARQIKLLRDEGIRVFTVPVTPPDKPEVLVRSVSAPAEVNEAEPFRLRATVVSNREMTADIDIFANGLRSGTRKVTLKPGSNTIKATQSVPAERAVELAVAVRAEADTIADNNLAATQIRSRGNARILHLADKPEQARYLARALKAEGITLDVRPATGAPNDLGELQNYDAVILDNIPATDLTNRQMEVLASYVRDFGGGFLMLGGENSFGLGGYHRTPIEEILPVRSDFEKEKETPSLGLILVVDRSGSMGGEKIEMAKSAAQAAVDILSPRDYAGVVAFDNEAFWVADHQGAGAKSSIKERIASIEAGGGTNIAPGLELALQALRSSPAKIKHVILLTDGVSTPGPFEQLAGQMASEKITLSTVAVGSDADAQLLQQLARLGSGRYYFTDSPQNIPQIFTRETTIASKSAVQEIPFQPVVSQPADFLVPLDSSPYLLGYVSTRAKPLAEMWLLTEKGEPLLATWRFGLGQAAAFTSDTRSRWAVEWLRWPEFGRFWAQVIRKIMRPAALRRLPSEIVRERGGYRLRIDAANSLGGFVENPEGEAVVVAPDGSVQKIPLTIAGPGRMEAWWPAPERGAYHVQVAVRSGQEPLASQYESVTLGYPDEFLLQPPNEPLLRRAPQETGGVFAPKPEEIFRNPQLANAVEWEIWPWLAGLALLLFVADVAVRRLDFSAVAHGPPPVSASSAAPPHPTVSL